jgi:uncharacterized protein YcaQ
VHRLTKQQARQIAVRAQLLDAHRPANLLDVVQRLTMLQLDPTAAIAPSADLVAWSRLGPAYDPAELKQAVEQDRTLFELVAVVRPMSDLPLYLAGAADWPPWEGTRAWLKDNDRFRRDILRLLRLSGPLSSREIPDTPIEVGDAGEPTVVEGVKGEWRLDPRFLDGDFEGRTALLSPFDRLIHDRARAEQIFEFEYILEMYKPAAKRRWGYFALPILHGERLVGKLDATADRKAGILRVNAIHEDVKFTRATRKGVEAELESLARWLGLET